MSEAKHTPGPWCISEAENSFEIIQDCWGDDGDHLGAVVVCASEIDPRNGGIRNKADAILIAAAPELLTKAKTLIEKLKTMAVHPSHYLELEEAIAKVEGGAA